ncbi:hypothetical protein CEXT_252961 [Caerostris extrusa]|uniref:BRCT domain-containing protein n=1 Tax=Caerostris extrusa TaxID=172846 RepID=A0AAV4P4Q4_CAEEX|nr:hypothetical protein CEXT_252961 [Caerostris extrusa]
MSKKVVLSSTVIEKGEECRLLSPWLDTGLLTSTVKKLNTHKTSSSDVVTLCPNKQEEAVQQLGGTFTSYVILGLKWVSSKDRISPIPNMNRGQNEWNDHNIHNKPKYEQRIEGME